MVLACLLEHGTCAQFQVSCPCNWWVKARRAVVTHMAGTVVIHLAGIEASQVAARKLPLSNRMWLQGCPQPWLRSW